MSKPPAITIPGVVVKNTVPVFMRLLKSSGVKKTAGLVLVKQCPDGLRLSMATSGAWVIYQNPAWKIAEDAEAVICFADLSKVARNIGVGGDIELVPGEDGGAGEIRLTANGVPVGKVGSLVAQLPASTPTGTTCDMVDLSREVVRAIATARGFVRPTIDALNLRGVWLGPSGVVASDRKGLFYRGRETFSSSVMLPSDLPLEFLDEDLPARIGWNQMHVVLEQRHWRVEAPWQGSAPLKEPNPSRFTRAVGTVKMRLELATDTAETLAELLERMGRSDPFDSGVIKLRNVQGELSLRIDRQRVAIAERPEGKDLEVQIHAPGSVAALRYGFRTLEIVELDGTRELLGRWRNDTDEGVIVAAKLLPCASETSATARHATVNIPGRCLREIVAGMEHVVEVKSAMPVLGCVRLSTGRDGLSALGTSLDRWALYSDTTACASESGGAIVPLALLKQAVAACAPDQSVAIGRTAAIGEIRLQVGTCAFVMEYDPLDLAEFPEAIRAAENGASYDPGVLRSIRQASSIIDQKANAAWSLSGYGVLLGKNGIAAIDRKSAYFDDSYKFPENWPVGKLEWATKVLEEPTMVSIGQSGKYVCMEQGKWRLHAKIGDYWVKEEGLVELSPERRVAQWSIDWSDDAVNTLSRLTPAKGAAGKSTPCFALESASGDLTVVAGEKVSKLPLAEPHGFGAALLPVSPTMEAFRMGLRRMRVAAAAPGEPCYCYFRNGDDGPWVVTSFGKSLPVVGVAAHRA